MQMLKSEWSDIRWRRFLGFCAGAMVLFYMVCPVAPLRWADLYASYGKTFIIAFAAIYFFRARMDGVLEIRLVIYYTIWVFLTRLFNTDYYLQNDLDLVISRILCCVILPVGLLLEEKERRLMLDIVIGISGAFYFVTALVSLYACIFGVYFYIPPEHVVFGLDNAAYGNSYVRIVAWETTRTISAVWFYLAGCMMVYEFFRCRNKLWRIPICIALFVFHLAVAFTMTRSVMLAASVNAAMLAILLGMRYLRIENKTLRIVLIAVLAAVSMLLCFKSYEWLRTATGKIYDANMDAFDVAVEIESNVRLACVLRKTTFAPNSTQRVDSTLFCHVIKSPVVLVSRQFVFQRAMIVGKPDVHVIPCEHFLRIVLKRLPLRAYFPERVSYSAGQFISES